MKKKKIAVFKDFKIFQDDDILKHFSPKDISLVNGIGSLPGSNIRKDIFKKYKKNNFEFIEVISPQSFISRYAILEEGAHVLANSIINSNAKIGANTIINSGAIVEHDCNIGKNNHIAPGASLSGSVFTGKNVHIGTGANIIQGINIGDNVMIGEGSTVTKDIKANKKLYVAKPYLK